ncbi:hypothetical protein FRC02_012442 [Tulasnella sp. 418]|nr:hypothetical protein FRC02_012442 [Tulasnella sp. 418]
MMDGRRMFPEGFHPMMPYLTRDGSRILGNGLTRTEAGGVRYFFIDFGISTMGPKFVFGLDGQERAPELTDGDNVPYDPFKLDVCISGMAYRAAFMTEHRGGEVILPLVEAMTAENPAERPTAAECVDRFKTMRSGCSTHFLRGFLRSYNPDTENVVTTFLLDWINKIPNFWSEGLPEADPIPPLESFWK